MQDYFGFMQDSVIFETDKTSDICMEMGFYYHIHAIEYMQSVPLKILIVMRKFH